MYPPITIMTMEINSTCVRFCLLKAQFDNVLQYVILYVRIKMWVSMLIIINDWRGK